MTDKKKFAVIGAGIAGLSCAYELTKAGYNVTVFEKEDYVGGRMASRVKKNLPFDIGADHLSNLYKQTKNYCRKFDIEWQKMDFLDYGMFKNGKVLPPEKSIGWISKIRLALAYLGKRKVYDFFDLSNAVKYDTGNAYDYMRKKAGKEVSDYFVDSAVSTYQFHGADEISLGALFGMMDSLKNDDSIWHLYHMKGEMSALPEAFAAKLNVKKGTEVKKVTPGETVTVETNEGSYEFDAAVLASEAHQSLNMLENQTEAQKDLLLNSKYSTTVSLSFKTNTNKLPKTSIVWVSHVQSKAISGYVNESMKGKNLINSNGETLLNAWLHESFAKQIINKSDDEIFGIVKEELSKVCPWVTKEELTNNDLQRWPAAMPKYSQGHLTRVDQFLKKGHQGENGIYFCGDYMNSPWVEGSIRCGQRTASLVKFS